MVDVSVMLYMCCGDSCYDIDMFLELVRGLWLWWLCLLGAQAMVMVLA